MLHSLLIPLNFALSEKRKLNTLWILVFQKQKLNKRKKTVDFASAYLWLQYRKQYFGLHLFVNAFHSPHSHTLAGITGNATQTYITQPLLVYRATPRERHRQAFQSSSLRWGRAEISLTLRRSHPFPRISLLVWCSTICLSKALLKRTATETTKGKCLKKKLVEHADPNLMCVCHFKISGLRMRKWLHVMFVQVWNMSVFLPLRNILHSLTHLLPICTFIGVDEVQLNRGADVTRSDNIITYSFKHYSIEW